MINSIGCVRIDDILLVFLPHVAKGEIKGLNDILIDQPHIFLLNPRVDCIDFKWVDHTSPEKIIQLIKEECPWIQVKNDKQVFEIVL